jgi:hypothetical protein
VEPAKQTASTTPTAVADVETIPVARPARHPLGPLLLRTRPDDSRRTRVHAAITLLICATFLGVAAWLSPDPRGYGTHTELGLGGCSWPALYGIPCPTCGMTTSFAHLVRGHVLTAFAVQPAGALAAIFTVILALRALGELITGQGRRVNWYRVSPRVVVVVTVLIVAAAWGYKILAMRAELG